MTDLPQLPPYIYGRETSRNEKVWTESAMHAYGRACIEADRAQRAEPVAWQERQAKRMRDGVVTEWSGWYECKARTIDQARAEAPDHIPYEWRPLYTAPPSDAAPASRALLSEARPVSLSLLRQALDALEHHREQTRPISRCDEAIVAIREQLKAQGET